MDKKNLQRVLYTPLDADDIDVSWVLVNDIINARKKEGITQRQIEILSGVKQPIISRMESGTTDPRLSTVLKILASFGKTLQIVPLCECETQERH